jgi:hypothetical protein
MASEQLAGDVAKYCRELESYLCQKNEGHLIRIVGPAFDRVCSWAERGVPLRIALRGIDRYCERYNARPGRRRPVRIEFCEAEILEAFDEWRRAVGVTATPAIGEDGGGSGRKPSLTSHVERVVARLRTLAFKSTDSDEFMRLLDRSIRELEGFSETARSVRGDARARMIERLAAIERELTNAAATLLDRQRATELSREAEEELAPFGSRLNPEARDKAVAAAYDRLVREALGLPTLAYE